MATVVGLAAILAVGLAFAVVGANGGGIGLLGDDADTDTDTPANPGGASADGDSDDENAAVGESDAETDGDAADDSAGDGSDSAADEESDSSEADGEAGSTEADSTETSDADDEDSNDGADDSGESADDAADETGDGTETDSDEGDADSSVTDGGEDGTDDGADDENDGAGEGDADDTSVPITFGERVTADAGEQTEYTVTASAGETVDVVASGQGGTVTLFGPGGTELASGDTHPDGVSFGAEAPADGEYTVVVDAGMDPVGLTVRAATDPSNTDSSSASTIGGGESVTADLTAGSTHWYELADGADAVTLENLRPYIGNDVEVVLLDANGNELDRATAGPEATAPTSVTVSADGAAYVAVRGANVDGATAYTVTVAEEDDQGNESGADGSDDAGGADDVTDDESDDADGANDANDADGVSTISLGERVGVASDATERFTFEADAGELLSVVASGQGGAVTLLGPSGEELDSDETTADGVAIGAAAPADGEYEVVVESGFDGVRLTVDAAEPASNTDRSSAVRLSDGDTRTASVLEGTEHWYAVEVESGEQLEAELAHVGSTSNTQVRVEIVTADGETLDGAEADFVSGGEPVSASATADEAGTYYVVVTGVSGVSEYELAVSTR